MSYNGSARDLIHSSLASPTLSRIGLRNPVALSHLNVGRWGVGAGAELIRRD